MYRKAAVIGKGLLSNRIRSLAVNHVRLHSYHVYNDSRRLLADPSSIKIDSSREAIAKYLPFTSEIITTKARSYDSIEVGYCDTCVQRNSNGDGKYIDDSWLQITLPFSRHALLRETLMRFDGETIRYGKLFEIFDALAGDVAYKHCGGLGHKLTIVTASVESMEIFTNLNVQRDVMLQGYLSYVGKSSMEVTIDVITHNDNGETSLAGSTQFIMVARNVEGKAAKVPSLLPYSEESSEIFEEGKARIASNKARALTSLSLNPPKPEEVDLIHSLFLQSNKYKDHSGELLPAFSWMCNTSFKSAQLMHHQNRNVHGKIFGGYLMKKAFELAWVTAVCFTGKHLPQLIYVDDVQFVKAVEVGSVQEFASLVIYSKNNDFVIQVESFNIGIKSGHKTTTNILRYIFRDQDATTLPLIMPDKYDEFILYLKGKRSLDQYYDK